MTDTSRDVTKTYSRDQNIAKLERLVEALRENKAFEIQVAGERLCVPAGTEFSIEHEQEGPMHELEFQFRWRTDEN
ncbi:MAG: amphi-Trp domain-containing protein [Erythrobacter sp.]|uniref:amphi-Trp domain-containing protein n=1 Tax=Erythrobacter sp. TaxID=1042 RepID=UPI002627B84A|nr:amphi-Trp domain-containing protein [Erythrobacter sp.]MDJ0977030.1 amphi-Trp domain-containing protein [Erythrobacter sp.]